MKRSLILVLFGILCVACSAPRIDSKTDDAFGQSLERVRASLPEGRRQTFDASLSSISASIAGGIDFASVDAGVLALQGALKRALNGKTGEEVIAFADDLKAGRQKVPLATGENHNTSDDEQRPPLAIGDNPNTSGNSFGRNVSAQFDEAALRRLYTQLNSPAGKARLQSYVCQNPMPSFTVTVVLWYEGPFQERQVRLQMTPPLYRDNGQIENGIGYLFEQGVKALDKGPPIDYGYRKPLGGEHITTTHTDQYPEPEKGDCGASGPRS